VRLTSRRALRIFDVADLWATRTGHEVRVVSANDHTHARRSAHYVGRAVDFISSKPDELAALFRRLGYLVLWKVPGHYGHVHVQEAVDAGRSERSVSAWTVPRRTAASPRVSQEPLVTTATR